MNEIDKLSLENTKRLYLQATERSPINNLEIKTLIRNNLTDDLSLENIFKGLDSSYYYESDEC